MERLAKIINGFILDVLVGSVYASGSLSGAIKVFIETLQIDLKIFFFTFYIFYCIGAVSRSVGQMN